MNSRVFLLLTPILGPMWAGAQSAQHTAAQSEMATLASAMEMVYIDTGWLTTLENLDDLGTSNVNDDYNYILDEGGTLVISAFTADFGANRVDLLNLPIGFNGWQGPYVTYQTGRIDLEPVEYDLGSPLDPWGHPYRFYTPLGLVDPAQGEITLDDHGDAFDRYMIMSYGPDGVPSELDLAPRNIGVFTVQGTVISSVRIVQGEGPERDGGLTLRIKGYFFGEEPGRVEMDGVEVETVVEWTPTLVTATLETFPAAGSEFALFPDGASQPVTFEGFLAEGATSVEDWMLY